MIYAGRVWKNQLVDGGGVQVFVLSAWCAPTWAAKKLPRLAIHMKILAFSDVYGLQYVYITA
jgi:hypothetical protein